MTIRLPGTDVVSIGLGGAGGVAVLPLTEAGIDVVGLEAGRWMSPRDFAPDELRNNYRGWPQSVQKANREVPVHRPNDQSPEFPRDNLHPMMNAVGGTTLHYYARSYRLHPWDFRVVSETTRRYGGDRIPRGSTVEDWPLTYADLEPFYDRLEYELGVGGFAGNVNGNIDPRGNIFEGPRARDYPMPPLRSTKFTEMMADAARRLGYNPFPSPAAINTQAHNNRPACQYHGFCNRGGCHIEAKNSTAVTTIPKAQATGNLKVVTEAHVTKILVNAEGRASGVEYLKDGETYIQPAEVVLLAGYTYENTRLLLSSNSNAYPSGLSNNHGQVGRHYMTHAQRGGVLGLFPHRLNRWYGLPAQGSGIDEWADDNFDHTDYDFIGGAHFWVAQDSRPILAARMNTFGRAPRWGSAWKGFVMENADRWVGGHLQKTTLPYEGNYLDLHPTIKDPLGFPVCRITAEYKDNEKKLASFTQEKMEQWFREAGAIDTFRMPLGPMGPSTHAYGGTRMGENPNTNVVNQWGFSHEVPNLGILGASVMGTSGARNPTLTVQALAWRTAQHLVENWRSISA